MDESARRVEANYLAFSNKVSETIGSNIAGFRGNRMLLDSYARIAALNAIKVDIVDPNFPSGAAQFFYEAHNDALLSHVNASFGSWRPALQSLRSFMENTLSAIFFLDHPVEFEKWSNGDFLTSPRGMREYLAEHPRICRMAKEVGLKGALDREYGTLSKAVHASNSLFRMTTSDGAVNIANPSLAELGKWSARERSAVDICVTALLGVLSDHIEGAKMQNLRAIMGVAVSSTNRAALKKYSNITIPSI